MPHQLGIQPRTDRGPQAGLLRYRRVRASPWTGAVHCDALRPSPAIYPPQVLCAVTLSDLLRMWVMGDEAEFEQEMHTHAQV